MKENLKGSKEKSDHSGIGQIPFFFIIGRPRSGTTLIQTLFEMHPNVIIPPESAVIKETYERFKRVDRWGKKELKAFTFFLFRIRKFRSWNIGANEISKALAKYSSSVKFPTLIRIVYSLYSSPKEKKEILLFGDKNPRYSRYPETMLQIMPGAKFMHIVRDYRDHILSMQRTGLLNGNLPLITHIWKKSQIKTFRFVRKHPDIVLSIRYEDFVREPEKHLKTMCEFLNIPYEPSVLKFHTKKEDILQQDSLKSDKVFHSSLFNPVSADNVGKWKKSMKKNDILRADFIAGRFAELSGYSRQFKKRNLKGLISALPGYGYIYTYYLLLFLIGLVPIRTRKKIKRSLRKYFPMGKSLQD